MALMEVTEDLNRYGFSTDVRVRLSETDAVGIVFFGSYASYMDVGRMDYLNHLGLARLDGPVRGLAPGAVVHSSLDFHRPARYNDVLEIHTRIARLGRTSYTFHFLLSNKRTREVNARGKLTLVWLDDSFQPIAIPKDFREAVAEFERSALE